MFPGLTELHLIGCLIELIWTQKKPNHNTQNQLADIPTKGNFTRDEWNHLLCLFNMSHFSSNNCLEVTSKRTQKESGEERVTAKSRPNDEFCLAMQRKDSCRATFYCIRKPEENQTRKSISSELAN